MTTRQPSLFTRPMCAGTAATRPKSYMRNPEPPRREWVSVFFFILSCLALLALLRLGGAQ